MEGEYEITIYEGWVSLEVQKSHDDEYIIVKSVELDDPLIRKSEEVVGYFIMWSTEFLRHACVEL